MDQARAPFLTYEDANAKALETLLSRNWNGQIPVDIEAIVEFGFEMDVVPVRGLKDKYSVDGFLTLDLAAIVVDEYILERHPTRYRFTLAHELGHKILHTSTFSSLKITSLQEWIDFYLGLDEQDYGWFERQAYWFAGVILVPEEPLVEEYEKVLGRLNSSGLTDTALSYSSRTQLAGTLAKRFHVSTGVMQRRLEETGIW